MLKFLEFVFSRFFLKQLAKAGAIILIILIFTEIFMFFYTRHGQAIVVPDFTGLSLPEVQKSCRKHRLLYEISDSVFINIKKKGSIIEQHPAPGSLVKKHRTIFLIINAMQPELVAVPDIIGVSFRQAKAMLEVKGLKIGKLEYVKDLALNNVLNEKYWGKHIDKNSLVPKFSYIDLVLGDGYGANFTYVPDLTGLNSDQSREKIADSYCNLGKINFDNTIKNFDDSLNAFVFRQYPPNEAYVSKLMGTYIDIWLTTSAAKIPLPDTSNVKKTE